MSQGTLLRRCWAQSAKPVVSLHGFRQLPDAVRRLTAEMLARPKDAAIEKKWPNLRLDQFMSVADDGYPISKEDAAYIHCTAGLGRAPAIALAYKLLSGSGSRYMAGPFLASSGQCHCNPPQPAKVYGRGHGSRRGLCAAVACLYPNTAAFSLPAPRPLPILIRVHEVQESEMPSAAKHGPRCCLRPHLSPSWRRESGLKRELSKAP